MVGYLDQNRNLDFVDDKSDSDIQNSDSVLNIVY